MSERATLRISERADTKRCLAHGYYPVVQGLVGLAAGHRTFGARLSGDAKLPAIRGFRLEQSNSTCRRFNSSRHRRGLGPRGDKEICSVSAVGPRQPQRARYSSHTGGEARVCLPSTIPECQSTHRSDEQDALQPHPISATQGSLEKGLAPFSFTLLRSLPLSPYRSL